LPRSPTHRIGEKWHNRLVAKSLIAAQLLAGIVQ